MSLFRQFNKTVCASRFTKPNNIILNNSCPSVYLCTSQEPSIDHVNTIKSLLRTINRLQGHSKNATYQKFITPQLQMLKDSLGFYTQSCRRYVELGGRLTGQGIANLYACADKLNVNAQWLKVYAQSEIPHLIRYMSVQNLKDLQQGLKKFNGNTDFASLVDKQLQTRNQQPEMYVQRATNELAVFEQVTGSPSNNLLVNMVESKAPIYKYYFHRFSHLSSNVLNSYLKKKPIGYALE